jgi:Na+/proline symporter
LNAALGFLTFPLWCAQPVNVVLVSILVYTALQLLVIFVAAQRPKSEADYLLAGRRLGPWLSIFSVFATWFGAENCVGAAAEAYKNGWQGVLADPFGYTIGLVLTGLLFGAALWRSGILTLADLFQLRYGAGVERLAAFIMIPGSLMWAAAQIRAFGQVLSSVSTLNLEFAIALAAFVVIAYTAVGGMWADARTDLVQGVVLIIGLFSMAAVFFAHKGFAGVVAAPAPRLHLDAHLAETLAVPIFGTIAAQELTARLLAMRSPGLARAATVAAGGLYLAVGLVPVLLGLGAAATLGSDIEPEQILSKLAQTQLSTPLYILFLGALVSAILSTLSGALLVAGSLAAHNLVVHAWRRPLSDRARLRIDRIAVIVLGIVAWQIARGSENMYSLVEEASGLGSSGVLVLMIFALWLPRIGNTVSAAGALLTSVGLFLAGTHLFNWPYPYLASLAAATVVYLVLSVLWPGSSNRMQDLQTGTNGIGAAASQ